MHETKRLLILNNGLRCMLCCEDFSYKEINWHHIKLKYVSKMYSELPDDSYENGSLVCIHCHRKIHKYAWWNPEYHQMMDIIKDNKKPVSEK